MILRWPLAPEHRRITQLFGAWPERYGRWGLDGHAGVDFGVPVGTPVLASNDGELQTMWGPQLGWQCWVVAEWGHTFYAHLSETTTPRSVRAGEVIAHSGNTGTETTGAHLHWELVLFPRDYENGYKGAVDPLLYVVEDDMAETITAARWNAEEAVREIEAMIAQQEVVVTAARAQLEALKETRLRLLEHVVPPLYKIEGA